MGLKTTNYEIKNYGITLADAYAQLVNVHVDLEGRVQCTFQVQQSRDNIGINQPLEIKFFSCEIDKDLPIHKQVYEKAKECIFVNWEDDIRE